MSVDLRVDPDKHAEHFCAFDYADWDELSEELDDLICQYPGGEVTVSFHRPHDHGMALTEAMECLVDRVKVAANGVVVTVCVATETISDHLSRYLPAQARPKHTLQYNGLEIILMVGDITRVGADVIANASNTQLKLGGGVSGAIRRAAGPGLQTEMSRLGTIKPGEVAVTRAHKMTFPKAIFHLATASGREEDVSHGVGRMLELCTRKGLESLAIPALGTGVGNLPMERCATAVLQGICDYDLSDSHGLRRFICVLWTQSDYETFVRVFTSRLTP